MTFTRTWEQGKLHRNFMGYTTQSTKFLLGLGVSSISDTGNAFVQNEKTLHSYYASVNENKLAVKKGYFLSKEDEAFRRYILDISCKGSAEFDEKDLPTLEHQCFPQLAELEKDDLIKWNSRSLQLTPQGHYFIRNICSAFDLFLHQSVSKNDLFSKAI